MFLILVTIETRHRMSVAVVTTFPIILKLVQFVTMCRNRKLRCISPRVMFCFLKVIRGFIGSGPYPCTFVSYTGDNHTSTQERRMLYRGFATSNKKIIRSSIDGIVQKYFILPIHKINIFYRIGN